ncbi:hypothetical protein ACSFXN_03870 [Planococcus sp. 1R117A]|uniref:hypothetical protein n=1 Tax=Planococcus sp. 1R117A TaxID=3447020 RepID=UPI003EDBBEDC
MHEFLLTLTIEVSLPSDTTSLRKQGLLPHGFIILELTVIFHLKNFKNRFNQAAIGLTRISFHEVLLPSNIW